MTAMSDSRRTEFARKLHDKAATLLWSMVPSHDGVRFKLRNLPDGGIVMEYEVRGGEVGEAQCVRVTVESIAALSGERFVSDG